LTTSRTIPYTKASACGNDFLLVGDAHSTSDASSLARITQAMCDRKNGIGADGVEWLYPPTNGQKADIRIRLFNADGSEAEISGNGTRCVAASYILQHGGNMVRVETAAGVKECRLMRASSPQFEFETHMGVPKIEGVYSSTHLGAELHGLLLNMGNPQCVIFIDEFPKNWQGLGADIQSRPQFPNGVNIDFVRVTGEHSIECRFFERGAGETLSSGTGSCASAVAAIHSGRVSSPVTVHALGGSQTVRCEGEVFLTGPAVITGSGEFVEP